MVKIDGKRGFTTVILNVIMLIWVVLIVYPFTWLILNSLKNTEEIVGNSWSLPQKIKFDNYITLWQYKELFATFLKNSFLVVGLSVVILLLSCAAASFALSRFKFRGNAIIYSLFIFGILLPQYSTMIPLFVLMHKLNLIDNIMALPLPYVAFAIPQSIFILTGFMKALPHELEEAAIIDGAGIFQIFYKVILPLSKPGLVTISIINAVFMWNEFLFPMLFTASQKSRLLSVGMYSFINARQSDYGAWLTGVILSLIPMLIFYSLLHEKIIKGMVAGALKG